MKKILTVVGARPQFVKAAMLSRALRADSGLQEYIVHTGQHYDANMSDVFFREMNIPQPWRMMHLGGGTHAQMTGSMMIELESAMQELHPDIVLVYGDTNSTLAGSLSAAKLHIPVVHVEAGLRSFNRMMPEEINRVLTDHLSSLLLCPTHAAIENLKAEGIEKNVFHTGDIMYDSARVFSEFAKDRTEIFDRLGVCPKNYVLCTLHRAENTENPERLKTILEGLVRTSKEIPVVLPLHPGTHKKIESFGLTPYLSHFIVTEPLDFVSMVALECSAKVIATDSGGIQKEAYFHSVPCVTFRTETEWIETVEANWNTLANPLEKIPELIFSAGQGRAIPEFGTGHTAEEVLHRIKQFLESPR